MRKVWVVFKREFLERVRSKWFIAATLLGPVFFGALPLAAIVLTART
jgi:ABC-type Na+ efflux pump permease subunit